MDHSALTPKQQRFVELFLVDLNATQAYKKAYGCSLKVAEANGSRLLDNAKVTAAIQTAKDERSKRTEITVDRVLEELWSVATADPNELVEYRIAPCRHCYGVNFKYQRTAGQLERDRSAWESMQKKSSKEIFDEMGGAGYTVKREPNPACPECFGDGIGNVHLKDTRRLSVSGRRLYAGVKQTKDGIEVKMHDKLAALQFVGKHLGMGQEREKDPEAAEVLAAKIRAALAAMDATIGAAA